MKKNYVLDTNILLQDSEAIYKFDDNNVIIPFPVLDEIDHLKESKNPETAYQSRRASRVLTEIRRSGVLTLPGGGELMFAGEYNDSDIPYYFRSDKNDHIILAITKKLSNDYKKVDTPPSL